MTIVLQDQKFDFKRVGVSKYGFYMDKLLVHNIDNFLIKGVEKKFDGIVLVTGFEGTGKSTFTQQLAAYCCGHFGHKLSLKNIVFTGKDLINAIDNAKVGESIIFDEAIMEMGSQDASTDMQKVLIKKFTLIRKKRLFIFLVIPSFFMLRKYFAIFRTRVLINCFCMEGTNRGYFAAYSFVKKKRLYINGIKTMNMSVEPPSFRGRFIDSTDFFVSDELYQNKKDKAIKELTQENEKPSEYVKLKDEYDLFKEKIKVQIQQYKERQKEKINIVKAGVSVEKLKAKNIEKEKHRIEMESLENNISKSIYYLYHVMDTTAKRFGETFDKKKFTKLMTEKEILDISEKSLINYLQTGEKILKDKI